MSRASDSEYFEHVETAAKSDPFAGLEDKYFQKDLTNQEVIDEAFLDLHELPAVAALKQQLEDDRPAYTTVFRYDPSSIQMVGRDGGCFGSRSSMGAYTAYARVFEGLQPEAVQVLRLVDDVQVVINQPCVLLGPNGLQEEVTEPTVLFSLRAVNDIELGGKDEAKQMGRLISHGSTPGQALPRYERGLTSLGILRGAIKLGRTAVVATA